MPDDHAAVSLRNIRSADRPAGPDELVDGAPLARGSDPGIALLTSGNEAFAFRAAVARTALRSLDLQYYTWNGDYAGRLLAREALAAADRGIRVRLLLDDAFALGRDRVLAALDAHPQVQVRLFNSTRWRSFGRLGLILDMLFGRWHLNGRMHNKCWIVDGRLAITGGRNIGDEYFETGDDFNFRDLDLILTGLPVQGALDAFERYWRSPLACSAAKLCAMQDARGGLPALRRDLDTAAAEVAAAELLSGVPDGRRLGEALAERLMPIAPEAVRLLADPPDKVVRGLAAWRRSRAAGGIAPEIADALRAATRKVLLVSPYFVPGRDGLALLVDLARRGVRVSVVTNSLAATDVVAVHGSYARYRRALLQAGVELFELKHSGDETAGVFGSRGASLHTKAFVVDDDTVGVGSFNLDPRSARLNTEMAVFAAHPALARALGREHARLADPARSWRVSLRGGRGDGRLQWTDVDAQGRQRVAPHGEPGASHRRRMLAVLTGLLPIESQL